MLRIRTLVRATDAEIESVRTLAVELGRVTVFSAVQVAEAMAREAILAPMTVATLLVWARVHYGLQA